MRETARVAYEYTLFAGDVKAESKSNPGMLIGRDDLHGTADITILNPGLIEIADLKTGKGVIVEPDDPQLKLYAAGALASIPAEHSLEGMTARMTIIQPRGFHPQGPIRSLDTSASDLLAWLETEVYPAAIATDSPTAPAIPSEDACRFCKAKGTCRELAEKGMAAAQAVFAPIADAGVGGDRATIADALTRNPDQLTPEQVRYVLDHESLITGWLSAVRGYASEELHSGRKIPGYKLVAGRSSRKWSVEGDELYLKLKNFSKQDGSKLGKADVYVQTPISPAQAEKQIKPVVAASTWKRIQELVIKSAGAPSLAPETDSRPALLVSASDVFQPIEQAEALPDFLQ